MASFRTVQRMLSNTYLIERAYGAALCKLRAVMVDNGASTLEKGLAYALLMDRTPQSYVEPIVRAIAAHPVLQDLAVVTETGSVDKGDLTYKLNTEAITDAQIAAVTDACWAALVAKNTPPQS